MSTERVYVGIDVSKDRLDIAVRPTGEERSEANSDGGIAQLVARLERTPSWSYWKPLGVCNCPWPAL